MTCHDGKGYRCPNPATVHLHAPDGEPVPGGYMCDGHAKEVTKNGQPNPLR